MYLPVGDDVRHLLQDQRGTLAPLLQLRPECGQLEVPDQPVVGRGKLPSAVPVVQEVEQGVRGVEQVGLLDRAIWVVIETRAS